MTLKNLLEACTDWNPSQLSFASVVTQSIALLGSSQRDLAREFEVAESTVSRWANEVARPHPRIQQQIVKAVKRRAKKALKAQEQAGYGGYRPATGTLAAAEG